MKRVNDYFYICEKGHVTVGTSNQKKKCDQKIRNMKMVKKGKAGLEKEVISESTCGEPLVKCNAIPEELNLLEKWDYHTIKAFMTEQTNENLKIKFIQALQDQMSTLHELVMSVVEGKKE